LKDQLGLIARIRVDNHSRITYIAKSGRIVWGRSCEEEIMWEELGGE